MIWVEILSRHHEVIARHRINAEQIVIGRGYESDVIIDDPMVAAKHLLIARDSEGRLLAVNAGSRGGLFDASQRKAERQDRITLSGHTIIRIGHTLLRIRDQNFVVAPEQGLIGEQRYWPMATIFFALVLVWTVLQVWLGLNRQPKATDYAIPVLSLAILMLVWTVIWTVLSRIFAGQARFFRHLSIATIGALVLSVFSLLANWSVFAFSWGTLAKYGYVLTLALIAALCYYHMRAMGEVHLRLKFGISAALGVLMIATAFVIQKPFDENAGRPPYLTNLEPPQLRFSEPQNEKAFLASLDRLRSDAEKDRQKTPADSKEDDEYDD